jgi:hypothetical protein
MKLHIRNSGKKYRKVLGITWLRKNLLKISGLICKSRRRKDWMHRTVHVSNEIEKKQLPTPKLRLK